VVGKDDVVKRKDFVFEICVLTFTLEIVLGPADLLYLSQI
jgi:hypothetical protein